MGKSREESVVYSQRPAQISRSNPVKRHRSGEHSSLKWYNLEKTKPVKEYHRCTGFDDHIPMEDFIKNGEQENRISSSAFEFEIQEQDKQFQCSEPTYSKSTECDSSASNLDEPDSDQGVVKRKKLELKEQLKAHNHQQNLKVDQNRDIKTGEYLAVAFENVHQSAILGSGLEANSSYSETALVDVHITVKASNRAENVPFVSLTSKLNGKAILGYPLEIRELRDGSETSLPRVESVARGSGFQRLVWRTSKRTPVCYVTNSLSSSISKNGLASNDVEDTSTPVRGNDLLIHEQSSIKFLKNPKLGKAAVSRTCVSVELIFSKLLAAVGQLQS